MKTLYESEFISSYWCQDRKLIYHNIHTLTIDNDGLKSIQDKLSEVYLYLNSNGIEFYQIYHPSNKINLGLSHMKILTKFAKFLKSQDSIIDEYCKGVSVVHTNDYVVKTVNYFIKLFGDKIPVRVVKDKHSAYEFLNKLSMRNLSRKRID